MGLIIDDDDVLESHQFLGNAADHLTLHTPVFYDPATGVLHNEALGAATGAWSVASRGWVQESWPRAMKDACPDLALPADPADQ